MRIPKALGLTHYITLGLRHTWSCGQRQQVKMTHKTSFSLTLQADHLNKCLFYKTTSNGVANVGVLTAVSDQVTQASVLMSEAYVSDWTVMLELRPAQHYSQINKGSSSSERTNGSFIERPSKRFHHVSLYLS